MIQISERWEYDTAVSSGFEPLIDPRFDMAIELRVEIQHEKFGRGRINTRQADGRFFRWVWQHKPHRCEETLQPLEEYSAAYCSHILTRGAHPEMANDPRNINILCLPMHERWGHGDRKRMRIYQKNQKIIDKLRREYSAYENQDKNGV